MESAVSLELDEYLEALELETMVSPSEIQRGGRFFGLKFKIGMKTLHSYICCLNYIIFDQSLMQEFMCLHVEMIEISEKHFSIQCLKACLEP